MRPKGLFGESVGGGRDRAWEYTDDDEDWEYAPFIGDELGSGIRLGVEGIGNLKVGFVAEDWLRRASRIRLALRGDGDGLSSPESDRVCFSAILDWRTLAIAAGERRGSLYQNRWNPAVVTSSLNCLVKRRLYILVVG